MRGIPNTTSSEKGDINLIVLQAIRDAIEQDPDLPRGIKAEVITYVSRYCETAAVKPLKTLIGRSVAGNDTVFRTAFGGQRIIDRIIDDWMCLLLPRCEHALGLVDFELNMASKVGPLSYQKPLIDRIPDLLSYFHERRAKSTPTFREMDAAFDYLYESVDFSSIYIKRPQDAVANMKLSTSAGLPTLGKRRNRIAKALQAANSFCQFDKYDYQVEIYGVAYLLAALLGWRGQEGGPSVEDVKQRVIWMFPFALNLVEACFYQTYIDTMAAAPHGNKAWVGQYAVDQAVTDMFSQKPAQQVVLCTDFTKFDQYFHQLLQDMVYYAYRKILQIHYGASWNDERDDRFADIFYAKFRIPMLVTPNVLIKGPHGMASGSGGTNADETTAHSLMQCIIAMRAKGPSWRKDFYRTANGDDGFISYPGIDIKFVCDTYRSFGLEMNDSKQTASTNDLTYLKRIRGF